MFSIISRELKSEMRCLDDLIKRMKEAPITPKPEVEELLFTWDWRGFVTPKLTGKTLKNHSFYHSFLLKKENGRGMFRAKKYPQYTEWIPQGGIRLLREAVEFSSVEVSEFRIETLNLDRVFSDLYTKYFPMLERKERVEAEVSWEKLRSVLENLPKKQKNLPPMRVLALPRQTASPAPILPHYLEQFTNENTPELLGERCIVEPSVSHFHTDIKPGMDVAVYTASKNDRPWLGRVVQVQEDCQDFEVQWYKRKGRSLNFQSLRNQDGSRYTSVLDSNTVMLWEFSDNKKDDSFDVSKEWLEKIGEEYKAHDMCYE